LAEAGDPDLERAGDPEADFAAGDPDLERAADAGEALLDLAEPPDLDRDRLAREPDRAEPDRDRRPAAGDREPDLDRLELRDPDPGQNKYNRINSPSEIHLHKKNWYSRYR